MAQETISISLTAERRAELEALAGRLNLTPEDLARAGIEDLLNRPDDAFQSAANRVLEKNAELYRRLA